MSGPGHEAYVSVGMTPPIEQRQPRQSRLVRAMLHSPRVGEITVTLRNLGRHGVGGRAGVLLLVGEAVTLHLADTDPLSGTVRWVRGSLFGIETDDDVPIDRLRHTAATLIQSASDQPTEFRIRPPVTCDLKRPSLSLHRVARGDRCTSDWIEE